eukprot:11408494-Alexandrium_andersonii.AAC.1
MSASLVGSEMCIRDSLWQWPACSAGPLGRAIWPPNFAALLDGADYVLPVSYTHLTLPTICSV